MQKQLAIKVILIVVIGLILLIPISMVESKVHERQFYLEEAKSSVANSWTGSQLMMSPVLVIPYQLSVVATSGFYVEGKRQPPEKLAIVLPEQINGAIKVKNKSVFKGIYEVPVYSGGISISGTIPSKKIQQRMDQIKGMSRFSRFGTPYITFHISDMRGIDSEPSFSINSKPMVLNPGSKLKSIVGGLHSEFPKVLKYSEDLDFTLDLTMRGMGSFSFLQLADNAEMSMQSDWPHPEFIGASLPMNRAISSAGFTASWLTTRFSNNNEALLRQCINTDTCGMLMSNSSGVNFIEPVDIYLQSERSVKYAILFIGLSFITFFIFENVKKTKIHPIQYTFVGLAISIFYLLLISLAEHIAFHWAYGIAVLCCSTLLLFYVRYMLNSVLSATLFSIMILALYGLLFVIVQAEDFALLMGAFLVFFVLTVVMAITRKFDWYSLAESE